MPLVIPSLSVLFSSSRNKVAICFAKIAFLMLSMFTNTDHQQHSFIIDNAH